MPKDDASLVVMGWALKWWTWPGFESQTWAEPGLGPFPEGQTPGQALFQKSCPRKIPGSRLRPGPITNH